jgi:hypothetical protein
LPSRNTASALTPFGSEELVGALADALREHHQLAHRRQFGRRRTALQLQRRNRFGGFQQVRALAVDRAQGLSDLGQDLLLAHHERGVLLGAIHQGHQGIDLLLQRARHRRHVAIAGLQAAHVARQDTLALLHLGEGRRHTDQCLRGRLGQTLRLGRGLRRCGHLGGAAARGADGQPCRQEEAQQACTEEHQQRALLAFQGPGADQGQTAGEGAGLGRTLTHLHIGKVGRQFGGCGLGDDGRVVSIGTRAAAHRWRQRAVTQPHGRFHRVGRRRKLIEGLGLLGRRNVGGLVVAGALDPVQEAHVVLFIAEFPGAAWPWARCTEK